MTGGSSTLLFGSIIGAVIVLYAIFSTLSRMFQKVGPNEVLVVSGGGGIRLIVGGASLVIPFLHKAERFSLEMMTIDIVTPEVITKQGVKIVVDAVAQVKVKNDQAMIRTAVERFLTKPPNEIVEIIKQTLEGHTRAIIGKMSVEELITERDRFAMNVAEIAHDDLANMGLAIDSFSIRDITDKLGYLEALGKPETAKVKATAQTAEAERTRDAQKSIAAAQMEAQIAQANAARDAQIAQANAARDAQIAQANARRDAEIAQANAQREAEIVRLDARTKVAEKDKDYKIKQAEYNQESKKKEAAADLSYDLQKNTVQQQVKEQEVLIQVVEKQKQVEVQQQEVTRREKELEATVRKPAEAQRFQIETLANAKQYELKTTALGEAEAAKQKGFAQAEVVRAQGIAEADAEKAQGLVRAEIIRATGFSEAEAMNKKAAAWREYNEAAILEMFIGKMPEIARSISAPLAKTEKIVMISSDGGGGTSKLTGDITRACAEIPPLMEALTGIKVSDLLQKLPAMGAPPEVKRTAQAPDLTQKPKPQG